ncbi:MAG: hypothetical protein AAF466_12795, partial [Bacteroidota bacterium]
QANNIRLVLDDQRSDQLITVENAGFEFTNSERVVQAELSKYQNAARNYPMKKVSKIISSIRTVDMKSKGVGASNLPQGDLLKELLVAIFDE